MSSSESTNLTRDGGPAKTDTYFASPELSQRADLLRHLTENSSLIPLIRGVEGMGKTTFIQHLLDLAPENWIPVEICADVMLQPDALLADLADLFDQDDTSDRLMDDLIRHFDDLRQDGFLPVIIVDDAHLLPEASIITLLRLHERGHNDVPLAQILLFAEPEIDELLKTPQLRVMNLQSLQLLDMPEFTLDQTELYLEHLLSAEESHGIKSLAASQIEQIHYETGGSPGLIKEHAQKLIDAAKKPSAIINLHGYFSKKSIIGGGLVSLIVMLLLIYQNDINAIFSGETEPDVAIQEEQPPAGDSVSLPIPEFVDGTTEEQKAVAEEPGIQDVPGDKEVVDGEDAVTEEEKGEVITKPLDPTSQTQMIEMQPEPAPPPEETGQPDVVEQSPEEENVTESEEVPPKSEKQAEQTRKEQPEAGKATPTVTPAKAERAQKVVQKAPEALKKESKSQAQNYKKPDKPVEVKEEPSPVKPVAKASVPAVKEPPKPADESSKPPQDKAAPTPAPVEERSTMLVKKDAPARQVAENPPSQTVNKPTTIAKNPVAASPKTASSGFLREEWLLKQKPSSYTIQLVGLQDEKGIDEFIQRHSVSGHIAYYRTQRKGKPWFPVLYGAYSTRGRAMEARAKLPESLIKSGIWLRTLGSVQKDIRDR